MKSDYDKWFIHKDGTAIKCKRENLIDALKDTVGAVKAAQMLPMFRRATFLRELQTGTRTFGGITYGIRIFSTASFGL